MGDNEDELKTLDADALKALPRVKKPRKPVKAAKAKRTKATKPKRKAGKSKAKRTKGTVVRCERLDMRLSKAEKTKVLAKAKKLRRTVTSIVIQAIEGIR